MMLQKMAKGRPFIKLLCRYYDPTQGTILLNNIDIRRFDYDEYQKLLATVSQDYRLLSFTIKENIVFDRAGEVTDEQVERLLKENGFDDKLENLEDGIHTYVHKNFEEKGFEPSGREGQKIALSRALYKDAPFVILDEPTAALDPRAEYEIYAILQMVEGKTAVFVSHRLANSKFCDKVVVFENGRVREYGTHEELLNIDGYYAELFHMQADFYV